MDCAEPVDAVAQIGLSLIPDHHLVVHPTR
jgi:hypothetical protein